RIGVRGDAGHDTFIPERWMPAGRQEAVEGLVRVLVTGGTGFVGSHTVAALHSAGHSVTLLARSVERAHRMLQARGFDAADFSVVAGDIVDADAVRGGLRG